MRSLIFACFCLANTLKSVFFLVNPYNNSGPVKNMSNLNERRVFSFIKILQHCKWVCIYIIHWRHNRDLWKASYPREVDFIGFTWTFRINGIKVLSPEKAEEIAFTTPLDVVFAKDFLSQWAIAPWTIPRSVELNIMWTDWNGCLSLKI